MALGAIKRNDGEVIAACPELSHVSEVHIEEKTISWKQLDGKTSRDERAGNPAIKTMYLHTVYSKGPWRILEHKMALIVHL